MTNLITVPGVGPVPADNLRAQYAVNASSMADTVAMMERTRKARYRGFTLAQWREKAETYAGLSQASDDALRAHMADSMTRIRARLAELRAEGV